MSLAIFLGFLNVTLAGVMGQIITIQVAIGKKRNETTNN